MYVKKKMYFHFMSGNISSKSSMCILLNDFWSVDCPNGMHCALVNHFIFHFNEILVYIESMQLHFIICGMVLDFLHLTAKWAPHSCKSRERESALFLSVYQLTYVRTCSRPEMPKKCRNGKSCYHRDAML